MDAYNQLDGSLGKRPYYGNFVEGVLGKKQDRLADSPLANLDYVKLFSLFNSHLGGIDHDNKPELTALREDFSGSEKNESVSAVSTSSDNINILNREFFAQLDAKSSYFISKLKRTDFENGMENEIVEEVEGYMHENLYVTISWLHKLYSNYQKDADVLAGLLRIIGMTMAEEYMDCLLTMVKAGLADGQSKTQEAAILVIEQWRTKNCLNALETTTRFSSPWIRQYANKVRMELEEELRGCC